MSVKKIPQSSWTAISPPLNSPNCVYSCLCLALFNFYPDLRAWQTGKIQHFDTPKLMVIEMLDSQKVFQEPFTRRLYENERGMTAAMAYFVFFRLGLNVTYQRAQATVEAFVT